MKNLLTARLYLFLMFVLIIATLTGKANAQSVNPEVVAGGVEGPAQIEGLAKVSRVISDRFGAPNLINVQPYFGVDGQYSGNSFEFFVPALNESVSAIL